MCLEQMRRVRPECRRIQSGGAPPQSKTQARIGRGNCGHILERSAVAPPGDNYEVTMGMTMALVSRGWRYGHNLLHLCFPHAEHDEKALGIARGPADAVYQWRRRSHLTIGRASSERLCIGILPKHRM
jgi:hypothetical protein